MLTEEEVDAEVLNEEGGDGLVVGPWESGIGLRNLNQWAPQYGKGGSGHPHWRRRWWSEEWSHQGLVVRL